jgi:anaphase-promoting complex subunit 3
MAPSIPHIATQLRQLIYYHLDNLLLRNALFLSERLVAYEPRSPEAAYLLALCQFQSGLTKAAWDSSRNFGTRGSHLGCAYVYAQACLELGRYVEGLAALERTKHLWQSKNHWAQHNELRRQHLPDAAAVQCLAGKLWKGHKNMDKAVECWAAALKLNPFMWDAFLGLCDSGVKVNVPNIYKMTPEMVTIMQEMQKENASTVSLAKSSTASLPLQAQATNSNTNIQQDPFMSANLKAHGSILWEKFNNSKISVNTVSTIHDDEAMNTPSTVVDIDDSMLQNAVPKQVYEPPPAPTRKSKSVREANPEFAAAPPPKMRAGSVQARSRGKAGSDEAGVLQDPPPAPPTKRTISGQVAHGSLPPSSVEGTRRSNRLANTTRPPSSMAAATSKVSSFATSLGLREGRDIKKARAPVIKSRTGIATTRDVGRVVSGNRTRRGSNDAMDVDSKDSRHHSNVPPIPALPVQKMRTETVINKDVEALQALLDLVSRISHGHLSLTRYDCNTAIQAINSLQSAQRETPHILGMIGKAYYEQAQYVDAEKFFMRIRALAPSRLEDMEVYSTVLWHTKSEIELAYLAHELSEIDRLSPQAWCAIGNSFSLQREHEQALKCFRRATQLDPTFAYGFTLQGHEYVANEEFEKALDAYRSAIAADSRHYNAWYGLGKVYEKMGKWPVAQTHYATAAKINPTNSVLICCIGMVQEKLKQPEAALANYTKACSLAPQSALSRFKKARCLMGLDRPREALSELLILKTVVPDEANVHFLLGRLYKMLRMKGEAVRSFTMALNLDPKVSLCMMKIFNLRGCLLTMVG